MMRITHNAHVFIIRPFVQLFWCSLVLFCFCFVFLWVCFFSALFLFLSLFLLYSFILFRFFWRVSFVGLVYLLLPISFLFRNVVVFSVIFLSLFFPFSTHFFPWSAFNSSLFSQICSSFYFSIFHSLLRFEHFSLASTIYLYAADVNWRFRYFSRSGFLFKYTRKMCSQCHQDASHTHTHTHT